MYFLPTTIIFIAYSFVTLIYTLRNRHLKKKNHILTNEILIALLFLVAGILFPFMYQFQDPNLSQKSLNSMWLFTSTTFVLEMIVLTIMLFYNGRTAKKDPEIMAERDYSKYCEEFDKNWTDNLKSEFGRKILHLFTCFIIFFFWTLGLLLDNLGILAEWGLDKYSFSYWMIITIGFGFVIMFQIGDLARLNKFYTLPKWSKKWYMSMRQEEQCTFIASTPLVLSFTPFLFTPFPIFGAVALITTGADAIACIIGKKYGKISLRKNSNKTIEGFIAGGVSTFLIVILIMIIYQSWISVSIQKILLMATVATILFLIVDRFARNISDNILNPLLTGLGIWVISLL
ncbi:MAG: hypothetical protein ACFFA3_06550 [Promethearchaeota archaeon]